MSVSSRFNKKGIANLSIAAGLLVAVSVVSAVGAGGLRASGVPENLENKEYQELSKAAVPSAGASVYASPVLSLYEEQEGAKGQGLLSAEASDSSVTGTFDPSAFGYTNLGICKVSEGNLNIRKTPSTDGSIVGKLRKNDAAEVLGEENGFTKIKSGEVEGYVKSEYLYTGEEALNAAKDATNQLFLANSEMNKRLTLQAAEASERAILDIETLNKINQDLIETATGVFQIAQNAEIRRENEAKQLQANENQLKKAFVDHTMYT